jgi:hypothetical protein
MFVMARNPLMKWLSVSSAVIDAKADQMKLFPRSGAGAVRDIQ